MASDKGITQSSTKNRTVTDTPEPQKEFVAGSVSRLPTSTSVSSVSSLSVHSVFATYGAVKGFQQNTVEISIDAKRWERRAENLRANEPELRPVDTTRGD
jgi:hypothetical protein